MTAYVLNDINLEVPEEIQTPLICRMLERGWYEIEEVRAIKEQLADDDIVLELGSGIGYLSAICAKIVGGDSVTTIEANPTLLPIIKKNLKNNGLEGVNVKHGVAVEATDGEKEAFNISDAFWASTRKISDTSNHRKIEVPALILGDLIRERQPTVLIVDIEGSEEDFFHECLPKYLRMIIIELHPERYSPKAIGDLFERLGTQNFYYETKGSSGAVIVFKRFRTNS